MGAVRGTRDLEGYLDVASGARRLPLPALLAADVREREGRISLPVTDLARRGFGALCEHPGGTEERRSRGNLHSAPVLPQHTLRTSPGSIPARAHAATAASACCLYVQTDRKCRASIAPFWVADKQGEGQRRTRAYVLTYFRQHTLWTCTRFNSDTPPLLPLRAFCTCRWACGVRHRSRPFGWPTSKEKASGELVLTF